MGILAGDTAHDFNNILSVIIGNICLAKNSRIENKEVFELPEDIEKASLKAKGFAQQRLSSAKGGSPVIKSLSISKHLGASAEFALRGSNVQSDFTVAENLLHAEGDAGQLDQVFNNLIINAFQAMPAGGTIRVAADNLNVDDGHGLPLEPGRYVKISIQDQWVGIAPKNLAKIFAPTLPPNKPEAVSD